MNLTRMGRLEYDGILKQKKKNTERSRGKKTCFIPICSSKHSTHSTEQKRPVVCVALLIRHGENSRCYRMTFHVWSRTSLMTGLSTRWAALKWLLAELIPIFQLLVYHSHIPELIDLTLVFAPTVHQSTIDITIL